MEPDFKQGNGEDVLSRPDELLPAPKAQFLCKLLPDPFSGTFSPRTFSSWLRCLSSRLFWERKLITLYPKCLFTVFPMGLLEGRNHFFRGGGTSVPSSSNSMLAFLNPEYLPEWVLRQGPPARPHSLHCYVASYLHIVSSALTLLSVASPGLRALRQFYSLERNFLF